MKKIGIIGRTAESLCDGQTVKTRILRDELIKRYLDAEIMYVETHQYVKNAILIIYRTLKALSTCDCIFILLSRNGKKVFFPFLYYANKLFHVPIYQSVIGGALDTWVKNNPRWIKYLNSFSINWVEMYSLKKSLESLGINNTEVLPNFKNITPIKQECLIYDVPDIFRFCTFSRVTEAKGIGLAAEAIMNINKRIGIKVTELHVYGPVEESYRTEFDKILTLGEGSIVYEGIIDYDKSVNTIKDYFALLFPTTFYGEGFPGTIVDAYSAGLPIIATNWHYNAELIKEGITGYCYDYSKPELLEEKVMEAIKNPLNIIAMKKSCIEEARQYSSDDAMKIVCERLNNI